MDTSVKYFRYVTKIQALFRGHIVRLRIAVTDDELNAIENNINSKMKELLAQQHAMKLQQDKENQAIYRHKLKLLRKEADWLSQTIFELENS